MKDSLAPLILIIIIIILSVLLSSILGQISDNNNAFKSLVGKDVIIKQDTLTIVDYSLLNETLTLDDRTVMSIHMLQDTTKVKIIN